MPTIDLTPQQFLYLQAAVARDLEALEEMAPWDVDDEMDQWLTDIATGRAVLRALKRVEQMQVTTH